MQARRRGREDVVRLRWAIDDKLSDAELIALRAVTGVRWAGTSPVPPGLRHEVASALAMWRKYRDSEDEAVPRARGLPGGHAPREGTHRDALDDWRRR